MSALPESLKGLTTYRRPLLLQGPMGPFFAQLADWLEGDGRTVHKVQFNGGDRLFYRGRPNTHDYTGHHEELAAWLASMLVSHQIDAIVLFGQYRPVHVVAREVAARLGLPVFVFEEGYLRPDYVTLERGGVNGHSAVPRHASAFWALGDAKQRPSPEPTGQRFARMAWYAALYGLAMLLMRPWFAHHVYHRSLNPVTQSLAWMRGGVRRLWHGWSQRHVLDALRVPGRSGRYFLLPLQVHNDSQIVHHSRYSDIESVIDEVLCSFADHARADDALVIKHHPMDRAYSCYAHCIRERVAALGLSDRVLYVHDLHLPTLLRHARGVVTVNSTTGLQALYHRVPVATLGDCFYAIPGLVHLGPLAAFWRDPVPVDNALFLRVKHYLLRHNQINASFYGRVPAFEHAPLPMVAPTYTRPAVSRQHISVGQAPAPLRLHRRARPNVESLSGVESNGVALSRATERAAS